MGYASLQIDGQSPEISAPWLTGLFQHDSKPIEREARQSEANRARGECNCGSQDDEIEQPGFPARFIGPVFEHPRLLDPENIVAGSSQLLVPACE
jgi:hypothetical protein